MRSMTLFLCVVACVVFLNHTVSAADHLLSHRAQYAMSIDSSKISSLRRADQIVDASGVMQMELVDACEGWSSSQNLNVTFRNADGGGVVSDTAFASWEAKDGSNYSFQVRNALNNRAYEQFSGQATLAPDGGIAEYTYPKSHRVQLPPNTLFPMTHLQLLLDGAHRGERVISRAVFEGTTQEGIHEINAVIGKPAIDTKPHVALPETVSKARYWPIRLAYFEAGQETPVYEVSLHLSENGVARDLTFDYGDFAIKASLSSFQVFKPSC